MGKRGRPPVSPDESSTDVHLTLSDGMYDRVYALAQHMRVSVPEAIRRTLTRELRNPKSTSSEPSLTL